MNLLVASQADVDRGSRILLAAFGVLARNQMVLGELINGAAAKLAGHSFICLNLVQIQKWSSA